MYGDWSVPPEQYADEVRLFSSELGMMDWAAIQDWMCEPLVLQKTGLNVIDHQFLTVWNYNELNDIAPEIPWVPVIQGWEIEDYIRHVEMYRHEGVELRDFEVVGLGSVCRRQATSEIEDLIRVLHSEGLSLHGFGVKKGGLIRSASKLISADSMAWSFYARYHPEILGVDDCRERHKNCANCFPFAMKWRDDLLRSVGDGHY